MGLNILNADEKSSLPYLLEILSVKDTGLNISMMRDYAEMVGGTCSVDGGPGQGTRVTAALPLAPVGLPYSVKGPPML